MLTLVSIVLVGYLIGSFPTSVLVARRRGRDVRREGSGNPGATNVLRLLGWSPAIVVGAVDLVKGVVATALGARLDLGTVPVDAAWLPVVAGSAAVVGHVWPAFAGFRGGKGVATAGGALVVLEPIAALASVLTFAGVAVATRIASVASLAAALAALLALAALRLLGAEVPTPHLVFGGGLLPFLVFTHRSNLARLRRGTEYRFSSSARRGDAEPPDRY